MDFVLCPKKKEKWHRLSCISGDCSKCSDRLALLWERAASDGKTKLDICFKNGDVMDLLDELNDDMEKPVKGTSFFQHLITAFWQFSQYKALKMSLWPAHDYHAVQKFTEVALQNLAAHISPIKELIMWSDECAAQYKRKGSFADLSLSSAFSPKV
ncbi:hypothetical protein RRG08_052616 [Elysia crispata]|uniref:Uncharacterized protein n=1 Tax=Elysia crispata TaxID=231223 RepID=A0AAE1AFM9_9GAST|nr:hypothetical protein RRG08_052616 [Elysia crispata]